MTYLFFIFTCKDTKQCTALPLFGQGPRTRVKLNSRRFHLHQYPPHKTKNNKYLRSCAVCRARATLLCRALPCRAVLCCCPTAPLSPPWPTIGDRSHEWAKAGGALELKTRLVVTVTLTQGARHSLLFDQRYDARYTPSKRWIYGNWRGDIYIYPLELFLFRIYVCITAAGTKQMPRHTSDQ